MKQEARLAQAAEVQAEWSRYADEDAFVVLIDAGHGAQDSGKVGVHGELEKDINLQIANRLYEYLVQEGVAAVRTRPEERRMCGDRSCFITQARRRVRGWHRFCRSSSMV